MRGLFSQFEFDHHHKPAPAAPPVDICSNKHGDNPASIAAFQRAGLTLNADRLKAYEFIKSRGSRGATAKEVALHLGKPLHSASARCSELKDPRLKHGPLIRETAERRDHSTVLVAVEDGK